MQSLPLVAICLAVMSVALAAFGGIVANIYTKGIENARRKEMEAEYVRVNAILKRASASHGTVLSIKCREWLRNYEKGIYAPFPDS